MFISREGEMDAGGFAFSVICVGACGFFLGALLIGVICSINTRNRG